MGAFTVPLLEKSPLLPNNVIYTTIAIAAARSIRESMQWEGEQIARLQKGVQRRGRLKRLVRLTVRHNPIYNLNCNPPNPIIKSHFHATCVRCVPCKAYWLGQYGRNISPQ